MDVYRCRQCREYPEGFSGPYYCALAGKMVYPDNQVCLDGRIRKEHEPTMTPRNATPAAAAWTPEEDKRLAALAHLGKQGAAEALGKSPSAVMNRAYKLGLSLAKREPGKRSVEDVLAAEKAAHKQSIATPAPGATIRTIDGSSPIETPAEAPDTGKATDVVSSLGTTAEEAVAGVAAGFSHCSDLKNCLADPTTTECGADPCNLVTEAQAKRAAENIEAELERMGVPAEVREKMTKPLLAHLRSEMADINHKLLGTFEVRSCRVCGCTDEHACEGGCTWVEEDLCSACAEKAEVKPPETFPFPEMPGLVAGFIEGEIRNAAKIDMTITHSHANPFGEKPDFRLEAIRLAAQLAIAQVRILDATGALIHGDADLSETLEVLAHITELAS